MLLLLLLLIRGRCSSPYNANATTANAMRDILILMLLIRRRYSSPYNAATTAAPTNTMIQHSAYNAMLLIIRCDDAC